ncbi:MAG TPA: hypothetical protein VF278_11980, partial [Pirellulales bacterium]
DVRLARAIGSDNGRDAPGKLEARLISEALEADEFQRFQHAPIFRPKSLAVNGKPMCNRPSEKRTVNRHWQLAARQVSYAARYRSLKDDDAPLP